MCIVVEETDETLFWFEILEETNLIQSSIFTNLKQEALELLKVFSKTKYSLK